MPAPLATVTETAPRSQLRPRGAAVVSGLATAHPPTTYSQAEALALLGLAGDPFAERVFARSGVRTRRLSATPATLRQSLQARAGATEDWIRAMALDALAELDFEPDEIGALVTAGYWSLAGPTLAHRLVDELRLRPDADKYHVTGVGCASAVPLLRLAAQALRDRPGQRALVVAAESVSGFMTATAAGDERTKVVGYALFGDGCGAALIDHGDSGRAGPAIVAAAVHQLPDSLEQVRFMVDGADSYMHLGRELPSVTEAHLPVLAHDFLAEQELEPADVDHWLVHPGGRGILEAAQRGLGLSDEQVAHSALVLREFGNVGTASSFFVLDAAERMLRPRPGERGLMASIGPGVTVGLMLFEW